MKKNLTSLIFAALTSISLAQNKSEKSSKTNENIYTSLRPSDLQPAVFSSQNELNEKIEDKKNKTLLLIKENKDDTLKLRIYREQLWRFENAIVLEPRK